MESPINRLEQELWDCCVRQVAAKDMETMEKWQDNPLSHLREGFSVNAMPSALESLSVQAIDRWKDIEAKICSNLNMSREHFIEEFEKARTSFLAGNADWKLFAEHGLTVHGAVRNMDWVNLFTWVLPNADREKRDEHRSIGRMVAAVFYTELLSNCLESEYIDKESLRKIEARWQIVN